MPRRVPYSRIKVNRSYTFEEAADVLSVTAGTVRRWGRLEGMPFLSDQRPFLILGWALKDFLKAREAPTGRKLKPGEFYCFTCKAPREPLGAMVDFIPITSTRARLQALCADCGGVCNRLVSQNLKAEYATIFDLQISNASEA